MARATSLARACRLRACPAPPRHGARVLRIPCGWFLAPCARHAAWPPAPAHLSPLLRVSSRLAHALAPAARAALDFQEDIKADKAALAAAKKLKGGQRMSVESASALRRKVGGTKSGFFGESIDVKGKYVEKGYVSSKQEDIPYLPFLIAVGA